MQATLDESLIQQENVRVRYGAFWPRVGALVLDTIILLPITFGVTYFNITSWKSSSVMLVTSLLGIAYKPFMEFFFGATLGKMALNLKVTNLQYEKANLQEILLRNIFYITPTLITTVLSIDIYTDPDFLSVTSYMEYVKYNQQFVASQYISMASGLITIVDSIILGTDDRKRSLHDRIAGTYVIEK